MFDLHAHVLPGIDDGPRTLQDAVALMRAMAHDGIEHVVATPHIYPGVFDNTPAQIEAAFEQLRRALLSEDIAITMTWAAEVRICPEILEWLELRRLPLLNGSLVGPASVLIELPDGQIPVGTDRLMGLLIDQGITPLIAHPERNKVVMEQPARLENLRQMGCQFQVTAGSVLGEFGRRAHATALRLLDAGHVDVIASDAHNLSGRRPRMQAAREWLTEHYDAALAERLMVSTPQKLAGIQSFSVPTGEGQVVFRDLPYVQDDPLGVTEDWLQKAASVVDSAVDHTPDAVTTSSWSLTDFSVEPTQDATRADPQTLTELSGLAAWDTASPLQDMLAQTVDTVVTPEEDWVLPFFNTVSAPSPAPSSAQPAPPVQRKAAAPVPAAQPAVPPATVQAKEPAELTAQAVTPTAPDMPVDHVDMVSALMTAPADPVTTAAMEQPTPAVTLMSIAQKLQRLRQNQNTRVRPPAQEPVFTRQVLPVQETDAPAQPQLHPHLQAPTLTEVVTPVQAKPALRPLNPVMESLAAPAQALMEDAGAPDRLIQPATANVPAEPLTARRTHPSPAPVTPAPTPPLFDQPAPAALPLRHLKPLAPSVQGFRLDQLTPRDTKLLEPSTASLGSGRMKPLRRPDLTTARPVAQMGTQPRSPVQSSLKAGSPTQAANHASSASRGIVRETSLPAAPTGPMEFAMQRKQPLRRPQPSDRAQGFRLSDISPQQRDDDTY